MITIIGAGPAGLITAISLHKAGQEVIVIDPRAGSYTRPGIIDAPLFELISRSIGVDIPNPIPAEATINPSLKTLERSLFAMAQELKIEIHRATFESLIPGGISVVVKDEKTEAKTKNIIPGITAIIDCSGHRRVVLNAVNQLAEEKKEAQPFIPVPGPVAPIKKMILACVTMEKRNISMLANSQERDWDRIHKGIVDYSQYGPRYAFGLEQLRTKFEWPEFSAPYFLMNFDNLSKRKLVLYMEAPPHLEPARLQDWVQANLDLRLELAPGKHCEFRGMESKKYGKKPRQTMFNMEIQKIERAYYKMEGYPLVLPLGESQMTVDFRLGAGIGNVLLRVNELMKALALQPDITQIDFSAYQANMSIHLDALERTFETFYARRRKEFAEAPYNVAKKYPVIARGLSSPQHKALVHSVYEAACHRILLESARLEPTTIEEAKILEHGEFLLQKAKEIPLEIVKSNPDFQDALLKMARLFKKMGFDAYNAGKFSVSERYYEHALQLFEFLPMARAEKDIAITYTDLCRVKIQHNNYKEAIQLANKGLSLLSDSKEIDDSMNKLKASKIQAYIEILVSELKEDTIDVSRVKQSFKELTDSINLLRTHFPVQPLEDRLQKAVIPLMIEKGIMKPPPTKGCTIM